MSVLVAVVALLSGQLPSGCSKELFRIERTTNANVVVYEVKPGASTVLDSNKPLTATWLMLARDGSREELLFFEHAAYGFDVHPSATGFTVTLEAFRRREVSIEIVNGCPAALVKLNGKQTKLEKIFVTVTEGVFPSVKSIDVYGSDPRSGERRHEKFIGE